ncbi:ADP-ribosylation factor-like protein 2-binding protein [Desmophyllum pertusum]|uniref:ADP-ribosylation factor-like protein 2-binding protein n=1 Tax=Desmophyllum pertusum TaxID=174260 RepID=A0A9W9YEJ7_9CNID|nr:ADP-ribosylation factor-like protein 2-binding protein [Desmophyllum pertusum]
MAGFKDLNLDEDLAVGRSSRADTRFDTTVGHIEDIIMEERFQTLQHDFKEKYYHHFTDDEENKLIYTDIFKEYVGLVENYIQGELKNRISGFSMEDFSKTLENRHDQIGGDILDMLLSFTDFVAFKQMFLEYKSAKEGTGMDFSDLITIRSTTSLRDEHQGMQIDPDSPREGPSSNR